MANLNTKTLAVGVLDILSVDGGISGNKQIVDGDGTASNLYIDGTNLGIGQSSPTEPLHILSSSDNPILIESSDTACGLYLKDNTTSAFTGPLANGNDLQLRTANAPRITIQADGDVGIGTTSPTTLLDVYKSGAQAIVKVRSTDNDSALYLTSGDSGDYSYVIFDNAGDAGAGRIYYDHNATEASQKLVFDVGDGGDDTAMAIMGDAKIGMGTTAPVAKLDVRGLTMHKGIPIRYTSSATISPDGNLNLSSTEGPTFVVLPNGAGAPDNLDSITIDGVTPTDGTRIWLMKSGSASESIIIRTGTGSATAGDNAIECTTNLADADESASGLDATGVLSGTIGSSYAVVPLMYRASTTDRWLILDASMLTDVDTV